MKFRSDTDRVVVLLEVGRTDLITREKSDESEAEISELLQLRRARIKRLKDFRKSQQSKAAWRRHKWNYMKGIHKWHRSISGKKFHRHLSRFLLTKILRPGEARYRNKSETLKALSSLKTHLYIEGEYSQPLSEEVDFEVLCDYVVPILLNIEGKLSANYESDLTDNELEVIARLIDESVIKSALTEFELKESDFSIDYSESKSYSDNFIVEKLRSIST